MDVEESKCDYCHQEFVPEHWISTWSGEHHYREYPCSCGKKKRKKVDFDGSGHAIKEESIDSVVRKVHEG